jgi:hypothetical protein
VITRPLADYLGVSQRQKWQILKKKMKLVREEEDEEEDKW